MEPPGFSIIIVGKQFIFMQIDWYRKYVMNQANYSSLLSNRLPYLVFNLCEKKFKLAIALNGCKQEQAIYQEI
uniref:Uncharacterized protein n=1 Tax=Tetranychus urticae TaxID=32264 RepID=T1KFL8_TETUR